MLCLALAEIVLRVEIDRLPTVWAMPWDPVMSILATASIVSIQL